MAHLDLTGQSGIEVIYKNKTSYAPSIITHDAQHIYWLDGNEVLAASKTDGAVRVVGKSSTLGFTLAEHSGYVYKVDRSRIVRFKSSGGDEEVFYEKANSLTDPMTVSPAGVVIWFTDQRNGGLLQTMSISARQPITLASGEKTSNFGYVIADRSSVYWIEPQTRVLKTVSLLGGPVHVIASECDPNHLMQDESYLFFRGRKGLMRASKTGFQISLVAQLPQYIEALSIDETHIYYAGWSASQLPRATGYISKVPKYGGASRNIAEGLGTPGHLLVDQRYVYFSDPKANMVARVQR